MAAAIGPIFMFFVLIIKNDFIKHFSINFEWQIIKKLLSLGIIYALSLLVISLNWKADIILIDKLSTPYELGIYSKGVSITNLIVQIPTLLSVIIFARSASTKDSLLFSRRVTQLLRLSIIAISLGSGSLILFAKYLIVSIFGVEFIKSKEVLQWLIPGILIITIFNVLNMDLAGKGKPWVSMKAMVPALFLNIWLNMIFIPQFGANGAAISSTISYTFASLFFLHFYSKEVKLSIKEIFHFSKYDFLPIENAIKKFLR